MTQAQLLVVVEVRLRSASRFGTGFESVTRAKRHRLIQATRHFLMRHRNFRQWPCRFDVVSVSKRNYGPDLQWIQNAFSTS